MQKNSFCGTSALELVRVRGFLTGVFDLPHEAHFRLLKAAREQCDYLIVGLTTDERCIQEKRKPVMSYEQRRAILENSKWVDLVVSNSGETKQIMLERLNFSILFTTDEYIARPEFTSFKSDYPEVRVIAFPVMGKAHTSDIIWQFENDVINSIKILCIGVAGPIYEINRKDTKLIIKPINVGAKEAEEIFKDSSSTVMPCSNIYKLPFPLPRNWKRVSDPGDKPNITGVNACREIAIIQYIRRYKWNAVAECREMIDFVSDSSQTSSQNESQEKAYLRCNEERQNPRVVYWLFQERCEMDLYKWFVNGFKSLPASNGKSHESAVEEMIKSFLHICKKIKIIVSDDLIPSGIIHGDLHMKNIGMRYDLNSLNTPRVILDESSNYIRLLDWGWCMHYSFTMSLVEKKYYDDCLRDDFDWVHFVDSVEYDLTRMGLLEKHHIEKIMTSLKCF